MVIVCITKFPSNSHNPQPIHTTLLIIYLYISFSGKQREHSDWRRKIYDLPHSIGRCWQGLRSVKDGALVWEDDERPAEHHMKIIRLDWVMVWHFGGKDVFVG